MRNPVRSETDAFYITLASAVLVCAALALGALVSPIAGGAVVLIALIGALVWELGTKDPQRRRVLRDAAAAAARSEGGPPRILVIANRTLHGDELRTALRRRADAEVHIVAPILTSRVHYIASDVDRELAEARERLATALEWAHAAGVSASGRVGDPNVALGAIEDELRHYGADEVIISTYPPGMSNWLETGIVERLREELDVPVTHVVVQPQPVTGAGDDRVTSGQLR